MDDDLILRLERMTHAVQREETKTDRLKILALIDDIEAVKAKLVRKCEEIDQQMRAGQVRTRAISTYMGCAKAGARAVHETTYKGR